MYRGFTCISCHLVFDSSEGQKAHYQSDWHRYNLKRQVAELPPISLEQFQAKVNNFSKESQVSTLSEDVLCSDCNKVFHNRNAYHNHLQSKKHLEMASKLQAKGPKQPKKKSAQITTSKEEKMEVDENAKSVPEKEVENEEEEHIVALKEDQGLEEGSCLFCEKSSPAFSSLMSHMTKYHGFYVPEERFCVDIPGLIKYLALKVGAGHMCIFCPERRATFQSLDGCRKHMRDKEHCRVGREAEHFIELEDFYDYDAMLEEEEEREVVSDGKWNLLLPSGASVGHRSLLRFYRQNLREKDATGLPMILDKNSRLQKALAWTTCTGVTAVKAAKDIRMMEKARRRFQLRVGLGSNKLFISRGRSDQ